MQNKCKFLINNSYPKTCADCPYSIENVEEQYDRSCVWYECKFIDGGANSGEKLKNCPLEAESEDKK